MRIIDSIWAFCYNDALPGDLKDGVLGGRSTMTWMPYYLILSLTFIGIAVLTFCGLAPYGTERCGALRGRASKAGCKSPTPSSLRRPPRGAQRSLVVVCSHERRGPHIRWLLRYP